jgi:transposase InsO family protein
MIGEYRRQLPVKRLAMLTGTVRTSYYRRLQRPSASVQRRDASDRVVVVLLHRLCAQETGSGYRRITRSLHERGHKINHKRVLRLMRQEKLLWRPRRLFKPPTTDSRHGLRVYPNLVKQVKVRRLNQVWVADITCVAWGNDQVAYLAVILDLHSRLCVGWALEPYLDSRLTVKALRLALHTRPAPEMHHSDRGVQYASREYIALLNAHNIKISMSRAGNPYDNAFAESFFKTLKTEEVDLQDYQSLDDARQSIRYYINIRYNRLRLHSSLSYTSPERFETAYINNKNNTQNLRKSVSP